MPSNSLKAPFADENAIGENPDAIANLLHLPEQMRRKQHGDAAAFQIENQVANFARAGRIDPGSRFIQNEQGRFLDERLGKTDALEHSLGISAEPPLPGIGQADELEHFSDAISKAGAAQPAKFAVETQRLFAGEKFVEVGTLRQKSDRFAAGDLIAVPPEYLRAPACRRDEPENDFQRGALSGTVGPEQSIDLAGTDLEIQIPHRHDRAALKGDREKFS